METFACEGFPLVGYEKVFTFFVELLEPLFAYDSPLSNFVNRVFTDESKILESIPFPLLEIKPDTLLSCIYFSENIPGLLINVLKDLLYSLVAL